MDAVRWMGLKLGVQMSMWTYGNGFIDQWVEFMWRRVGSICGRPGGMIGTCQEWSFFVSTVGDNMAEVMGCSVFQIMRDWCRGSVFRTFRLTWGSIMVG